jgi:hypothetical protein
MVDFLRPDDLRELSNARENAKFKAERIEREKMLQQKKELEDAFRSKELHPEVRDRVNSAIRQAAELGRHEIEVMTFPASYCNDRGRRINIADPEWPESLEGFAKRAFDFFHSELRPLGYKLRCEIISFPDGIPGDVGMYLRW